MVQFKFIFCISIFLTIAFSNLSLGRRPYFSDEDDEVDNYEEEGTPVEISRQVRKLKLEDNQSVNSDNSQNKRDYELEKQIALLNKNVDMNQIEEKSEEQTIPCTCGIFLSGQFQKLSKTPPKGNPVIMNEMEDTFQCNNVGNKHCTNKCLELLIKHLPNSPTLICSAVDRDVHKERAYLFVKNCEDKWHNSNLSAGREYCCKDNEIYKCPSS